MRIAIIGGGIGGLSAALALRHLGLAPEVFEQAPELLEVGAAIAVWPNAMRGLSKLGLREEILQHAGVIEHIRWLDWRGKPLNSVRLAAGNYPAVALHRADLQNALLHALCPGSIHLGKVFAAFQQTEREIEVQFADGSAIRCDLLIGADGLHSRVRTAIVDAAPPSFRGYNVWRGITRQIPRQIAPATATEIHGSGRRFGIGPVGLNRLGWWASANPAADDRAYNGSGHDPKVELLKLFTDWTEPVLELIESTKSDTIIKTAALDRPASRTWGVGRATLLGDAIHPTTPNLGQGGCIAIEDAIVLARCLTGIGDAEAALRCYERLRYARTSAVSRYSRLYGTIGQWESVRLRAWVLSLLTEGLAQRALSLIFDYDAWEVPICER